jgi:DNA recombination protein RmuC
MEITTLLTFLVIILIFALIAVIFYFSTKKVESSDTKVLENSLSNLSQLMQNMEHKVLSGEREMKRSVELQFQESQKLIGEITEKMRNSDAETRKAFGDQFDSANRLIKEITTELTEVKEGNKQVLTMTEQLSNLEKVLTNQKQRGNWGESSLELILSNFLQDNFQMQYMFKNGEAVDAVIHIRDKYLPIDSKFSLDNYQRAVDTENEEDRKFYGDEFKKDLKLRITETAKYIRENENTLPIAFMFIPSEAIYYDLLAGEQSRIKINTQAVLEYAQKQRVFIVSPTSILAYLHLVLSGIKAFRVEEGAKQIQKKVEDLGRHITNYEEFYKKLGSSLSTTVNHYTKGYDELKKIDKDVYKITDGEMGGNMEVLKIEKPQLEE